MGKEKYKLRTLESMKPNPKALKPLLCSFCRTVGLVLFYYCFSITLTFYNKKFISVSVSFGVLHVLFCFVVIVLFLNEDLLFNTDNDNMS